jgi:hypothetical protein
MIFLLRLASHFSILITVFLVGCAGSKSSSGSNGEFTNWAAVSPNVIAHFSSGNSSVVSSTGTVSQTNSSVNANILFDSGYNISSITLNQSATNFVTYAVSAGDTIVKDSSGANFTFTNQKTTSIGILGNPYYWGYQYQTYGAWGAWGNVGAGGNAVSIGALTPSSGIPSSGNAVFSGGSNGYLINGGYSYITSANMTANVNFATQSISFATTGTTAVGKIGGSVTDASGLNLTGTMSYTSGKNLITGAVTSTSGMSGSIIANFYGPNANEIGGTYGLTKATTGTSLVGGFGGKR